MFHVAIFTCKPLAQCYPRNSVFFYIYSVHNINLCNIIHIGNISNNKTNATKIDINNTIFQLIKMILFNEQLIDFSKNVFRY